MTGSLRAAETRVLLSVELIDVATESVVWAQNYAREAREIFSLQDEVVRSIAATLTGQVELDIATRAAQKHPGNLMAYDLAQRGVHIARRTVTKYRKALGIESSSRRKQF